MIEYGTTEWYEYLLEKSILEKELLEEAIEQRKENSGIEINDFLIYGEIMARAARNIDYQKQLLKYHMEALEGKK